MAGPAAWSRHQLRLRAATWWLSPGTVAPSVPAVRFHTEMMAGSASCLNPCPGSWGRGSSRLQIAGLRLLVKTARGQAGREQQLPHSVPWASCQHRHLVSESQDLSPGTRPSLGRGGRRSVRRLTDFPAWSKCSAHLRLSPHPHLQPPATCAPCGTPEHGDGRLPAELPALPHRRGPPHVLPTSPRPGPSHCRCLLPPQLPGPAPLPPPGLQVS